MSGWCTSFVLIPTPSRKVKLCVYLARLNQTLIRTICSGPLINDILPTLLHAQYLTLIDVSSQYQDLN